MEKLENPFNFKYLKVNVSVLQYSSATSMYIGGSNRKYLQCLKLVSS